MTECEPGWAEAPSIKEALEQALRTWENYEPNISVNRLLEQGNAMASAIHAALATLSPPAGERREAIAGLLYTAAAKQIPEDDFDGPATWDEINKKISDPFFQEHYPETVAELVANQKHYRALADALLASDLGRAALAQSVDASRKRGE